MKLRHFAFAAAIAFAPLAALAQVAAQWSYSFVGGVATASYPGNASVAGNLTVGSCTGCGGGGGSGNVNGPASSFAGDISLYADTTGKLLADSNLPVYMGVGDGVTNNITSFVAACNAGGAWLAAGTYVVDLVSGTTLCTPPSNTMFRGAGQGKTILDLVVPDANFLTIFNLNSVNVTFRDMTIKFVVPVGGTAELFNTLNSDFTSLINDEITSNSVEGFLIGGTGTTGNAISIPFLRNGSTTTVTCNVTTGQTAAQMATACAATINATSAISSLNVVATANGAFVGIAQPDSLGPQFSYAPVITGSSPTETVTEGENNLSIVFNSGTNGDESDDVLEQNVYMHDVVYNMLKQSSSTQTNRRWKIYGGYFTRVTTGFANINSPGGVFSDFDIEGLSGGAVGVGNQNDLPIAFANVQEVTAHGIRLIGTYNANALHFEQGVRGTVSDVTVQESTSGNSASSFSGDCLFLTDNNVTTGTATAVNDFSINNIRCIKQNNFSQGTGLFINLVSAASIRDNFSNIVIAGWPACVVNDGAQESNLGPFVCTNFAASTGTTAVVNTEASNIIQSIVSVNYATVLSNTGGSTRAASCTGTTC